MAELTSTNTANLAVNYSASFINSGLQAGLSELKGVGEVTTHSFGLNKNLSQQNESQVTISPQARLIQKNTADQLTRLENEQQSNQTANEQLGHDSIRVSSSIGEAASSVGLTEQEAIKLYQSIKELL